MTVDAVKLREQLEAATGERTSALEGIGETVGGAPTKGVEASDAKDGRTPDREFRTGTGLERDGGGPVVKNPEPAGPAREKTVEKDFGL